VSAAHSLGPGIANAQDDIVSHARSLVREAVKTSEGFPDDARLAKAQMHLVAAMAELVKYENEIGGPRRGH